LCTPAQMPKYVELTKELKNIFMVKGMPGSKRPRGPKWSSVYELGPYYLSSLKFGHGSTEGL